MSLSFQAVGKRRDSDPSDALLTSTAKAPSEGISNESKPTSVPISEVLSAQTVSSGESPRPYPDGEWEATTRAFSPPIHVPMKSTRYPSHLRDYVEEIYQPPPPSRMPESRPLTAPHQHSSQTVPVRKKGHNLRLSDTNPASHPSLSHKYEAEQSFGNNVSETSSYNSPTSPPATSHPRQQSRTASSPAYYSGYSYFEGPPEEDEDIDPSRLSPPNTPSTALHQPHTASLPVYDSGYSYFLGPHEEDENVYSSRLRSSNTDSTTHPPITSIPVTETPRANAPAERSAVYSKITHFATPTRLEYDPSAPINTPDHLFPPLAPTTVHGRSEDMDNEQVKGPPTMPKVYPAGRPVARSKPKGGGSDAFNLHIANPTLSAIASGSINVNPLSDLPMPMPLMLPAQATQRRPPTPNRHLHSDDTHPSSSFSNSQSQDKDTSPATSSTTGTPTSFSHPSGHSPAGRKPKPKPNPLVSSHKTEQSRFKVLRLWDWFRTDSKKLDKGKQRQQESAIYTQTISVRSVSPPLSISGSGYLVGTTDLRADNLDKDQVFGIRKASNSKSRERSVGVEWEHVEGGPSKSRTRSYPLDPFDAVLLDHDRRTGELLRRLNPTDSPTFYDYGASPPREVLDLGCGQGHWVVQAAIKWGGYGTIVTGYDKVDIWKPLLPLAIEHGVEDQIKFVRGNFLKQQLPFEDDSFDLVRMSCLTLCIPTDAWALVFQEVCRVLAPSGRVEVIEDSIIFPPPPLVATPLNLEFLFEQMLLRTFGISLHPETFISQSMKDIFGYGEVVEVLHLTPAHSPPKGDEAADADESSPSAGLLLLPSTFFPMEQEEVDLHMSKHMRSLLSCKHLLIEYAIETATNEEVDDEMVLEALYEYESSMHQRLDPLPLDTNGQVSDSQNSSDRMGTLRTFRVFGAIKMEGIIFPSIT